MKNSTTIAISIVSLVAITLISGCGSSTSNERIRETSATTTYVPSPPPQVVVQPAPVVVSPPPTTVTTTEEKSRSNSTDTANDATRESSEFLSQ